MPLVWKEGKRFLGNKVKIRNRKAKQPVFQSFSFSFSSFQSLLLRLSFSNSDIKKLNP
jgi:hypothetical protein